MSQKTAKKKSRKSSKVAADASVLGTLRSTRPTRLGGGRRGSTTRRASPVPAKPAAAKSAPKQSSKPKAAKQAAKPKATKPKAVKQVAKPTAAKRPVTPPPRSEDGRQSGPTEIVTTAFQAAGELAQIGATVGSQLLKRAARRIPRL